MIELHNPALLGCKHSSYPSITLCICETSEKILFFDLPGCREWVILCTIIYSRTWYFLALTEQCYNWNLKEGCQFSLFEAPWGTGCSRSVCLLKLLSLVFSLCPFSNLPEGEDVARNWYSSGDPFSQVGLTCSWFTSFWCCNANNLSCSCLCLSKNRRSKSISLGIKRACLLLVWGSFEEHFSSFCRTAWIADCFRQRFLVFCSGDIFTGQ